jgi:hypothetical protein
VNQTLSIKKEVTMLTDAHKRKLQTLAIPLGMWAFVDTRNGVTCEQAFAEMQMLQDGMEPTLYDAIGRSSLLTHGEVIDLVMAEVDEAYAVLIEAYELGAESNKDAAG